MAQGSRSELHACNDFLAETNIVVLTGGTDLGGGVGLIGVNEGSLASTVDEPGGILAITTDTADNDNHALISGPFKPADGGCWMETRFKMASLDCAIYAGFSQTLARDTPVMPAEFATATMTYNGTGGMIGLQYDVDGTTDDWRAVFADGGAALSALQRANVTVATDVFYIVRVEVTPAGFGRVLLGEADAAKEMRVIKEFNSGTPLDPTDIMTAVLMIENRSANARVLEVDYFEAMGSRDWTP